MVAPSLLVAKVGTTPLQVYRLTGGTTLVQVGADLSGTATAPSASYWVNSKVQEFRGALYVHFISATSFPSVAKYNPVTDTWVTVHTTPSTDAGSRGSGLWIAGGTSPRLFFVDEQAGTGNQLFYTTDGTTWVNSTVASTPAGAGRGIMYRDKLYIEYNGADVRIIDPIAATITTVSVPLWTGSLGPTSSWCVFRNRLYAVRNGTLANGFQVFEFTGGTLVARATLLASTVSQDANGIAHALVAVGSTKMVAIICGTNNNSDAGRGTRAYDLTPTGPTTFTVTDVTSPLIPAALRTPQTALTQRWTGFVDDQTTPGAPAIFFWHLSSATAGTYSYYEYVDSATELSPGSAGPNQGLAFPADTRGGGDRIWDGAGSLDAIGTAITASPVLGHSRLTVLCSGDTTGTGGVRTSVRLASVATLPANTPAGTGVGKTLTGNANGALSMDATLVAAADRVLVKDEAAPANNGLYTVTAPGDGSNPFVLTRATDFDQVLATEVSAGAWARVTAGATLSNTYWQMTQTAAITLETTALPWAQLTTRFLRFWHSANETPNLTQGTLGGTPSGQAGQLVRNVNVIEGVIADGASTVVFDWNAGTDGFSNGSPTHYALRLGTT